MKRFGQVSKRRVSVICVLVLLATSLGSAFAQQPAATKRAVTHQDYDSWRPIQAPQISRDGKFVAYAFMAQDGDSEIVVRNLATGNEWPGLSEPSLMVGLVPRLFTAHCLLLNAHVPRPR